MKITQDLLEKVHSVVQELNNPYFKAKLIKRKLEDRYGMDVPCQVVGKALSILAKEGRIKKLGVSGKIVRYRRIT